MKLQITTLEQSKRLLDIGLPKDSADCFIHISECVKYNFVEKRDEIYKKCEYGVIGGSGIFGNELPALLRLSDGTPEYLPCWSAGRLIDIWETITPFKFKRGKGTLLEDIITKIEASIKYNGMDFSKLEN